MAIEVPGGLTPKPVIEGNELIFAFRASDGTPIKFTGNQLIAALVKLNTVNGQSLFGEDDITISGGGLPDGMVVDNKVTEAFLPLVDLMPLFNPAQFSKVDGKITYIPPSGELITPLAPDAAINLSARTLKFIEHYYPGQLEYRSGGGAWINYTDGTEIPFGTGAVVKNYHEGRVKALAGQRNPGAIGGNPAIAASGGGGGNYIVERTFRIDTQSEYSSAPSTTLKWNSLKPTNDQLSVNNGYTTDPLYTETNVVSTVIGTVTKKFSAGKAAISDTQEAAGFTGLYPNEIVNSGWDYEGSLTEDAVFRLSGLKTDKYYQVYVQVASSAGADDLSRITVNGVVKTKLTYNNFGVKNEAEFSSAMWCVFNNVQATGGNIDLGFKRSAGGYVQTFASVVLQESNIAKP